MILLSKHNHYFKMQRLKKKCLGLDVWGDEIRGYSAKFQFITLFIEKLNTYNSLTTHLDLDCYASKYSENYWASELKSMLSFKKIKTLKQYNDRNIKINYFDLILCKTIFSKIIRDFEIMSVVWRIVLY